MQTEAEDQYRRNRRFLQKTGENHKFDLHNDFNPFDTNSPIPEIQSAVSVSQNSSPKPYPSSQPYITRFGRAVKRKVITSM